MAMTKAELVAIVSDKCSFSRQESVQIVDQVFQILKETLEKGEKVKISGFGNFITREKRSRKGKVFYGCSKYPECSFVSWDKPGDKTEEEQALAS